jgi:hypothetical protein
VKALKVDEVLNIVRGFIFYNLEGDFYSMKFYSAVVDKGIWTVRVSYVERGSSIRKLVRLNISDASKEVMGFNLE